MEHGEITVTMISNIRCEHNQPDVDGDVIGNLILTNYKLLLKTSSVCRNEEVVDTQKDRKAIALARV